MQPLKQSQRLSKNKNNNKGKTDSSSTGYQTQQLKNNKRTRKYSTEKQMPQTKKSKLCYAPEIELEPNTTMHFNSNNPSRSDVEFEHNNGSKKKCLQKKNNGKIVSSIESPSIVPRMKERIITPIKDINPMIANMTIKGRCISVWHAHKPNKIHDPYGLECILQDEESSRIQIFVKREFMFKFEPYLREGQCYIISNFGVVENNGRIPMLANRWKIAFYKDSKSTRIEDIDENFYGVVNEPFSQILDTNNHYHDNDTVDVFGTVVSIGDIVHVNKDGCSKLRRTVMIENTRSLRLECTFWDKYALMWNKYADDLGESAHLEVIMILGKIKYWKNKPSIHNAQFGTRIFIHRDPTPFHYFQKRYEENNGYNGRTETHIVTPTDFETKKKKEIVYIDLSDYETKDEDENFNTTNKLVQVKLEKNPEN